MSKKDDSILYGAKRAGVTWLFKFKPSEFNEIKVGAKRLGMNVAEFLCRTNHFMTGAPAIPEPRKFTDEDRKASTLKLHINPECDEFTRRCLERQAALWGGSVEEYLLNNVFMTLENDEDNAVLDPQTGEGVLESSIGAGHFFGCNVDKRCATARAQRQVYSHRNSGRDDRRTMRVREKRTWNPILKIPKAG
jgi:hypothetical protein